ncbi:hypothetical protein M9458_006712, partial [Cirrhinus mrigala]
SYKSVDGRTTPLLCGTNPSTPQPSSPDTGHFHLLHEYSSVAPEMLMLSGLHTPGSRDSQRLLSNEDTRCSTPDTYEEMAPQPVQPWERRTFPLDVEPQQESEILHSPAGERHCRTIRRVRSLTLGLRRLWATTAAPSKNQPTHPNLLTDEA